MKYSKKILELAEEHNGTVTTELIRSKNYPRGSIKYLADIGKLERIARGVYILPNYFEDEFLKIQSQYKRGVFSLETILYLHDLTDRTPLKFHMTFVSNYNTVSTKKNGVVCHTVNKKLYEDGIEKIQTPLGNSVRGYSLERTLCEILVKKNNVDIQIVSEAFRRYMKRKERNIPLLSKYSKDFNVENKLKSYLEVLL